MFRFVGNHQKHEKRRLIHSLVFPTWVLTIMFSSQVVMDSMQWDLYFLGVKPLTLEGLPGILLAPFVHSGWQHFFNNSFPFLVLAVTLFYFYRDVAYRAFITIYILAGAWLWFGGREAWHIGASHIVYGLAAFLFVSGLIRRHVPLIAISLAVSFIYGNLIWGMIPLATYVPYSWEGHLWGFVAGITAAWVYRHEGPLKPQPAPDEQDDDDPDNQYWLDNQDDELSKQDNRAGSGKAFEDGRS